MDVFLTILSVHMTSQVLKAGIGHEMYDNDQVKMMWVESIARSVDEGVQLSVGDMANINCKPLLAHQCQAVVARKRAATAQGDVMEE